MVELRVPYSKFSNLRVPFALLLFGDENLTFLLFNSIRLPLTMDSQWALQ